MKDLHSIEVIEREHVFQTGCNPLLIHASDLNYYVCKYLRGNTSADKLFLEYLAVSFLKIWEIPVPDYAFVKIRNEDLTPGLGISSINLNCPSFGSLYNREFKEIDKFLNQMSEYQGRRFSNPEEFLSIAFFDIWVCNDDRHTGNFNLFVHDQNGGLRFVAFDHEAIFNTNNLNRGIYALNENDSILTSHFLFQIISQKQLKSEKYLVDLRDKWYNCIKLCREGLPEILSKVPKEWHINLRQQNDLLLRYLFDEKWISDTYKIFLEILQISINRQIE